MKDSGIDSGERATIGGLWNFRYDPQARKFLKAFIRNTQRWRKTFIKFKQEREK